VRGRSVECNNIQCVGIKSFQGTEILRRIQDDQLKQTFQISWVVALLGVALFLIPSAPGQAQPARAEVKSAEVKLHDLELWDQDGTKVKFKTEVVGDRIAAIVPFYTTCTTAYPILIFIFTRLQEMLGDRLGREVVLVSVSVDPNTDIPIRLKAFARRQKARPGWTFVCGDINNLAKVLTGIGVQYIVGQSLDEHQHIPVTLVGDPRGEWKRFFGYPSPEILMTQINQSLNVRQAAEGKK